MMHFPLLFQGEISPPSPLNLKGLSTNAAPDILIFLAFLRENKTLHFM